jgi:general secretion pathway protein I
MTPRRAQRGFTLLEVVVAFVLLALTLVTAFQIFSAGLARASELGEYSRALVVAQSRIAVAGVEEKIEGPSEKSGESEDRKYRWTLSIQPYEEAPEPGPGGSAPQPQPQSSLAMYKVEAVVAWEGGDGRARNLKLSTLTLASKL